MDENPVWAEFGKLWVRVNKHHEDIYEGRGPADPPLTLRAAALESRVTALEKSNAEIAEATKSRQKEIRGFLVAILLLVLGDVLGKVVFK